MACIVKKYADASKISLCCYSKYAGIFPAEILYWGETWKNNEEKLNIVPCYDDYIS